MTVHSQINAGQPVEQLELIRPAAQAPTQDEARCFLKSAMRDAMKMFPAENTQEAMLEALSGNDAVMDAALDDMLGRWPKAPGTMVAAAAGTALVVADDALTDDDDDDANTVWGIEPQAEIEITRLPGGSVKIHEPPGSGTQAEGESVVIAPRNVVTFAYNVLAAAGFKGVLIATGALGGYCDLEDGDTPDKYAPERQKPGYGGEH